MRGKACRRKHRCMRRHKKCFHHCTSQDHRLVHGKKTRSARQCKDICFKHAKRRACNTCHTRQCRHHRRRCFGVLKQCQAKCHLRDFKCRAKCRCPLKFKKHKKTPTTPKTQKPVKVVKPVVAKPVVETVKPAKPLKKAHRCACTHRVRHCAPVKKCTLRDTKPVKVCAQEENTKVVLCECAKKDAAGQCVEKKTHMVCVKHDKAKKCLKQEVRCIPSCKTLKCVSKQGTKCVKQVCAEYNTHEEMKCVKYEMSASHACKTSGFSHKCTWKCVKRSCAKHTTTPVVEQHQLAVPVKPKKKTTDVKVLDNKGHEYTEKELRALKSHDKKAFDNIVNALHRAEGQVKSPGQAYEIKEAENKILEKAKSTF